MIIKLKIDFDIDKLKSFCGLLAGWNLKLITLLAQAQSPQSLL